MNVQISSMSAFALRVTLTWNSVGILELLQKLPHFTLATGGDVFLSGSKQSRQVARLQMLLKGLRIEQDSVRLTILREDDGPAGLVHVVENLLCIPLQVSYWANVFS